MAVKSSVSSKAVTASSLAKPKVTIHAVSATKIKVSWKKVKGVDKYGIYRYSTTDVNNITSLHSYKLVKKAGSKTTSWTNKNLTEGKFYAYTVVAYKGYSYQRSSAVFAQATSDMYFIRSVPTTTDGSQISALKIKITNLSCKSVKMNANLSGMFYPDLNASAYILASIPADKIIKPGATATVTYQLASPASYDYSKMGFKFSCTYNNIPLIGIISEGTNGYINQNQ
jgi:Fibronectin type III domain.